jgi:hypothetical protein
LAHLLPFAYWAAYSESKLRLIGRFFTAYVFVSLFFIIVPSCRSFPHRSFPLPSLSSLSSFLTYILFIMAKSTKSKAVKSFPKKSHAESSTIETKKTGHQRRKAATATTTTHEPRQSEVSKDDEPEEPTTAATLTLKIPACVVWDKYPERTERLLDYLDAHPDVAIKLFGDSTQAAKSEGRSKLTAKSNKGAAYLQVADGIFSLDHDAAVRADFATNPNKYAKAVDNYITNT